MYSDGKSRSSGLHGARTMKLVLLDIDGTLTDTNRIDTSCFVQAIADTFGFRDINTDWSAYANATDSGICEQLVCEFLGRLPADDEIPRARRRFHSLLREALSTDPVLCHAIAGGPLFLQKLLDVPNCAVGFATGGWNITARLKLTTAGYDHKAIPMASCDDACRRIEICKTAATRLIEKFNVRMVEQITYVGDGAWDARAAAALGYRFVGVGHEAQVELLRREGAVAVIPDFESEEVVDQILGSGFA